MSGSKGWRVVGLVAIVTLVMILSSSIAGAGLASASPASSAPRVSGGAVTVPGTSVQSSVPSTSGSPAVSSVPSAKVLGTNNVLAASVQAKEQALLASGGSLANFHPPNLHQAPPLKDTNGLVTPLYYVAPAPWASRITDSTTRPARSKALL